MMFLIPLFVAASLPAGPPNDCHAIDSESVLARDIAVIVPGFSQLPGDFLVGYVQTSGAPRIFSGADLERIAKNRGVDLNGLNDLCLMRRTFIPQPAQIVSAMQKTIGIADAKIEILSSSQRVLPTGEVIFSANGVQQPAGSEITWQGYVQSVSGTKFPLWARARVIAMMKRVVAIADLQPRKPISSDQVRLESGEDSPFDEAAIRDLNDVVGFVPKIKISKSSPLRKMQIERPVDVAPGDLVTVEVVQGAAHLHLEARAQNAGSKGSIITVRNLASGKEFRAEVTGKERVMVGERTE